MKKAISHIAVLDGTNDAPCGSAIKLLEKIQKTKVYSNLYEYAIVEGITLSDIESRAYR